MITDVLNNIYVYTVETVFHVQVNVNKCFAIFKDVYYKLYSTRANNYWLSSIILIPYWTSNKIFTE